MLLHLSAEECDYLQDLLEAAHKEKLHELHHADRSGYKRILREKVGIIEGLKTRLEQQATSA